MRSLFQSGIFKRLFFTYLRVILFSMILYIVFLGYSYYHTKMFQLEKGAQLQAEEAALVMERSMMNAQDIVKDVVYSPVLKDLYMNYKLNKNLDSYTIYLIQSELKNTMVRGDFSIAKTIVFLDGKDTAYSSGGVIMLADGFSADIDDKPLILKGSLNEILGIESKRYSFTNECLVYHDSYTYQNGSPIGTVVVLLDNNYIEAEIGKLLREGYGISVFCGDTELISVGKSAGRTFEMQVKNQPDIRICVYASKAVPMEPDIVFFVFVFLALTALIFFIVLAYKTSSNYYTPIGHISNIVNSSPSEDEMEGIIGGIRELIGEKNIYKEKMLTISPYIKEGVMHSVMTGNMEAKSIQILSDENYFDLIKPFYMVSVVNLTSLASENNESIENTFKLMAESFTNDEVTVVYYLHDNNHIFVIINSDNEAIEDDIFYSIHKHLQVIFEKQEVLVTMGVDRLREDINELLDACDGAMKALDGILTDGRGEVYFLEEHIGDATGYYFPEKFKDKLTKYLDKGQKEDIHSLLMDLYEKNWDLAGAPEMYRALIDELHLSIIKALREATQLNMTHAKVEKYRALATLREIFDYYEAALFSIVDSISREEAETGDPEKFEEEILNYIEENAFNPDLSLQLISDYFKVSNKYLSLLCKKNYGTTYLNYIQTKRINKAAQLLESGKYSLSDVALMCGYTNQLTFRRNFKSIKGINPSDYE